MTKTARIWVDADACPRIVRDILCRAANRVRIEVVFVANRPLAIPRSRHVRTVQVASGFDVADEYIVAALAAGDLVVSADIPLAAEVIARGADCLSPRGERFDADNVRERLSMRDFMSGLRDAGIETGGQAALGRADQQRFANHLDRWLQHGSGRR